VKPILSIYSIYDESKGSFSAILKIAAILKTCEENFPFLNLKLLCLHNIW
jgi:hypothetical protein